MAKKSEDKRCVALSAALGSILSDPEPYEGGLLAGLKAPNGTVLAILRVSEGWVTIEPTEHLLTALDAAGFEVEMPRKISALIAEGYRAARLALHRVPADSSIAETLQTVAYHQPVAMLAEIGFMTTSSYRGMDVDPDDKNPTNLVGLAYSRLQFAARYLANVDGDEGLEDLIEHLANDVRLLEAIDFSELASSSEDDEDETETIEVEVPPLRIVE